NAKAFGVVTKAVDQGLVPDQRRIADLVAKSLAGPLSLSQARGEFSIGSGQARLTKFSAESGSATLSASGSLDLATANIDARLTLTGPAQQNAARPEVFVGLKGPVSAPERRLDVSAFTAWLNMRAVDNQTRQLRAIEAPAAPSPPKPQPA